MHTVDSLIFTNLLFLYMSFVNIIQFAKIKWRDIMLSAAYENRTPDVTLAKLDDL